MTVVDYAQAWSELRERKERGETPASAVSELDHPRKYYRPLADAADRFIHWTQHPDEQVYTGIEAIDMQLRGIAPGEMAELIGYSHSGKTLVLLEILRHNNKRNVVYFCPDEPQVLTLIKLTCLQHNINGQLLEERVREGDKEAIALLRETATIHFPNLMVVDESVTMADMEYAYNEAEQMWSKKPDFVVVDYLDLIQGGGEDVSSKANAVKSWGRRHDVPLLVLHQTSRSAGADGREITISSGGFGGEAQATHIIGVRRKINEIKAGIRSIEESLRRPGARNTEVLMEKLQELQREALIHKHTLTVNLVKNKRWGGALVDDVDFEISKGTGRLRPLNGDLPLQYKLGDHY